MTVSSNPHTSAGKRRPRTWAALASMGLLGGALVACTPDEYPTDVPGTTPSVVTGNQAPPGEVDPADGIGASPEEHATADLVDDEGNPVGTAEFVPGGSSVTVTVRIDGDLPAGFHGMHIHENGNCDAEGDSAFTSAGGHLQVDGNTGFPASGDLININVLEDGTGETVTTTDAVTFEQVVGKALMIHEDPSNFANIPTRYAPEPDEETVSTQDAGPRIACGVIEAHE